MVTSITSCDVAYCLMGTNCHRHEVWERGVLAHTQQMVGELLPPCPTVRCDSAWTGSLVKVIIAQ